MTNHPLTLHELLDRIDRYFDCTLSDREERELRSVIATTTLSHPAIDEARALMGFRSRKKADRVRRRPSGSFRAVTGIAAAIALILTLAVHFRNASSLPTTDIGGGTCIAYVNGCRITDEADVVSLMMADLREFESGADDIRASIGDELGDIAPLIQAYETDLPAL